LDTFSPVREVLSGGEVSLILEINSRNKKKLSFREELNDIKNNAVTES